MDENANTITPPDNTGQATIPTTQFTAEDLVAPIIGEMPEPTGDNFSLENSPTHSDLTDEAGTKFDPAVHKVDSDGKAIREGGKFVRNKRGRPPGKLNTSAQPRSKIPGTESPASGAAAQTATSQAGGEAPDPDAVFSGQAETCLRLGYGCGALIFGEDFFPENEAEHKSLKDPLVELIREKGGMPLTPTQAFCFAVFAFGCKKYQKPTIKERCVILYMRIKTWFGKKGRVD